MNTMRRLFGNLYFLTFLIGFLISSLVYLKMEANYENELFAAIRTDVDTKIGNAYNDDSVVVNVMHACHLLMSNRESVFQGKVEDGWKVNFFHPTSMDLLTANGACGSFALVLARVLQNYDFPVRVAQMKAVGVFAAHNIVEVKTKKGWVVLDALFDVYFKKPDHGGLASFADVAQHWSYYKKQLPANYDQSYDYEDVRYSNWTKLPVLMPAMKKVLDRVIGKPAADRISLRTYFLSLYDLYFTIVSCLLCIVSGFALYRVIKTQIFPQTTIPINAANLSKYLRRWYAHKPITVNRPGDLSTS